MKIFTRYMAGKFLAPFAFGLGTFALLVFLGDLFDKMNKIATSSAAAPVIAEYLLLQVPYWTIRVVPLATLLAALFAVSGFVRSGEYVAVQAAGFESKLFFRPLLWLSLTVAAAAFTAQETVLPACYRRAESLWRDKIFPEWEWDKFQNVVLAVGQDRLLSAGEFKVGEGALSRPVLDTYGPRGLSRQLDAEGASWDADKGVWIFRAGVDRSFTQTGEVREVRPFHVLESDLTTPPKKLRPHEERPDEMSILETLAALERIREQGRPTHRMRTGLHAKFAYPFTNLILCALGIPIALRLRRASRPIAFAAALVVGFFYIWVIEMGWFLGKAGRLPPPLAAWVANAAFGLIALALYRRAEA